MSDQRDESNKMVIYGNHQTEPGQNRPEVNTDENPPETAAPSLKNLIVDCLEMIFDLLDIKNLLNVAGTCKRLQSEAASFFNRKFSMKDVTLYHNYNHSPYICVAKDPQIKGLKSCLAFLRCFGAGLSELTVQWHTWAAYKCISPVDIPICLCHTLLDQYINRYCAESLSTITFYDKSGFSSENYVKPFVKIETVRLFHCGLEQHFPKFINLFPHLRTLKISQECTHRFSADTQLHFTHLQHLYIDTHENDQHKRGIKSLLRANPQLQSLRLYSRGPMKMSIIEFVDMISANQSLLKLSADPADVNKFDSMRFVSEHPLINELDVGGRNFTVDDAFYLMQHLYSLNKFSFGFKTYQDRKQFEAVLNSKQLPWVKEWKYERKYAAFVQLTRE